MKKTVCIYPKDPTTDFLLPLYEHICNNMHAIGIHDDTTEENALDKIYAEIHDAESVVFLGHGTSDMLCGSRFENIVFEKEKCDLLCNKRLLLLACNSNQFIKKYDLHCAVGFGFLPTSLRDARYVRKLHSMRIEHLQESDIEKYNTALVDALINTLSNTTMADFHLFKERLKFYISGRIVQILLQRETPNYRLVADALYYVYKDVISS